MFLNFASIEPEKRALLVTVDYDCGGDRSMIQTLELYIVDDKESQPVNIENNGLIDIIRPFQH